MKKALLLTAVLFLAGFAVSAYSATGGGDTTGFSFNAEAYGRTEIASINAEYFLSDVMSIGAGLGFLNGGGGNWRAFLPAYFQFKLSEIKNNIWMFLAASPVPYITKTPADTNFDVKLLGGFGFQFGVTTYFRAVAYMGLDTRGTRFIFAPGVLFGVML